MSVPTLKDKGVPARHIFVIIQVFFTVITSWLQTITLFLSPGLFYISGLCFFAPLNPIVFIDFVRNIGAIKPFICLLPNSISFLDCQFITWYWSHLEQVFKHKVKMS